MLCALNFNESEASLRPDVIDSSHSYLVLVLENELSRLNFNITVAVISKKFSFHKTISILLQRNAISTAIFVVKYSKVLINGICALILEK